MASGDGPTARRRSLGWALVLGLPVAVLAGVVFTLVVMRQSPSGGPWSRWDLLAPVDVGRGVVVAVAAWVMVVGLVAAVTDRGAGYELPLLICVVPGLFAVVVFGGVRLVQCPSQFPREDMLEPYPAGTAIRDVSEEDSQGSSVRSVVLTAPDEDPRSLEERTVRHYEAEGWSPSSQVSAAGVRTGGAVDPDLAAGEWSLDVAPTLDAGTDRTHDGAVILYLGQYDEICDWPD